MASIKETLENSDTFKGLPDEWLARIAELARLKEYPEKSYLFLEGE